MKTNKKNLSQKQIITEILPTKKGYEATVIARDNFMYKDQTGKLQINMSVDSKSKKLLFMPGDETITFNKEKLKNLHKKGEIPSDVFEQLMELLHDCERRLELAKAIQQSKDGERNLLEQQLLQSLQKDPSHQIRAINAIRELLEKVSLKEVNNEILNELEPFQFNPLPIDKQKDCFGINKHLMDRFTYWPELLNSARLIVPNQGQHTSKIRAKIEAKNMGTIGLEHTLSLSNKAKTPEEAYINYLKDMQGYALKVFLAYWLCAYEHGSTPTEALFTEIMNKTKGTTRKGRFTPIERRRFWECSQLLESTYLTISIKIKKETIKVRHQLLVILRTSSEEDDTEIKKGYPTKVYYGVLDPEKFKEAANLYTQISKEIVKLDHADIMLALMYAIKRAQNWGDNFWEHSIEFLMRHGGFDKTNKANPRQAKKRLIEKTQRIKKAKGIEDFEVKENKLIIKKKGSKNKK